MISLTILFGITPTTLLTNPAVFEGVCALVVLIVITLCHYTFRDDDIEGE